MRSKTTFIVELAVFVAGFFWYGLARFRLGIDLTDEGAYLAWPLQVHLGEKPFASELLTLVRPVEVYLSFLFKLHPAATLYELRLLGWSIHLLAFYALACFLFRLSGAPLRSVLVASLPVFTCHIFGLATPSYNTLSSDFLTITLSLWGLASLDQRGRFPLGVGLGISLFIATFAHPGLGLVAATALIHEISHGRLIQNCRSGRLSAPNIGIMVFVACWLGFLGYFWSSGTLAIWTQRLSHSRTTVSFEKSIPSFLTSLLAYPFTYSRLAMALGATALLSAGFVLWKTASDRASVSRTGLGVLLVAALSVSFSWETDFFLMSFVMISLVTAGIHFLPPWAPIIPGPPEMRFLILLSCLAAMIYAALTYYFSPYRSWIAGLQGLPFAFAAGFALLVDVKPRPTLMKLLLPAVLALVVLCAAREHYRNIYRDAPVSDLQAGFTIPKLRSLHSTAERIQALNELYEYLRPKLARGDPLIVYDDCPMLYYLFDARPAYGLAWAVRYGQRPATLSLLNDELNSRPLPRYAIRTLVDVAHPIWHTAPKTGYADYPLDDTVAVRYELEKTIFPFEIWRLKTATHGEKTSPVTPDG